MTSTFCNKLQNKNNSFVIQGKETEAADLSDLLIVLIKRLAVFPVEESGDAHNFFLLVDNGQRQDILDDETRLVHSLFLKRQRNAINSIGFRI